MLLTCILTTLLTLTSCQIQEQEQNHQEITWTNAACSGIYTGNVNEQLQPNGFGSFNCSSHRYVQGFTKGVKIGQIQQR